jgi:hypothetical protein
MSTKNIDNNSFGQGGDITSGQICAADSSGLVLGNSACDPGITIQDDGTVIIAEDATCQKDLTILGTLVSDLRVADAVIETAVGQVGDLLTTGYFSHANTEATESYSGLLRDRTTKEFHLFTDETTKPLPSAAAPAANALLKVGDLDISSAGAIEYVDDIYVKSAGNIIWQYQLGFDRTTIQDSTGQVHYRTSPNSINIVSGPANNTLVMDANLIRFSFLSLNRMLMDTTSTSIYNPITTSVRAL